MSARWISLLGVNLRSIFALSQTSRKKKNKRNMNMALMIVLYVFVGLIFAVYCGVLSALYVYMGMEEIVMPMMMTIASVVILITSIFKANGFLFASRDDDLLLSLPVDTHQIIVSRLATLYIFDLVETAVVMLPSLVVVAVMSNVGAGFIISVLMSILFIPMIPLAIAALIGIIVTYISCRFKHKNFLSVVFGMLFVIIIMFFSMSAQNMNDQVIMDMSKLLLDLFRRTYFPTSLYISGLSGNVMSLIGFIVLSLSAVIGVTAAIAWKYKRITTFLTTEKSSGNYRMQSLKTSGTMFSLYRKEFKLYTSIPVYVLNTAFSFVFMIIIAIALFFVKDIESFLKIPGAKNYIALALPIVLSFFMALSSTTYPSISLEGKKLWLTAHLPVPQKQIYHAKLLVNLTLSVPTCIISSVLLIIRFRPDTLNAVMTFLVPLAYGIFVSIFGLWVNLKFPNFDWVNPVTVIKQGIPAMICIFGGMIVVIIPAFLIFTFSEAAHIIYIIVVSVLAVLSFILYRLVSGTKLLSLTE